MTLPDGWARAALAGIEAALIGWGLMMLLVLVGYLGVSSNPWLGETTWSDARGLGGDAWAAVLGAPVTSGSVTYRAIPTLMTILVVLMLRALLIPGRRFPAVAQWMSVPTFTATALLLVVATADRVSWLHAAPGALAIPLVAAGWAVAGRSSWFARDAAEAPRSRAGRVARDGLLQARGLLAALAACGLVALGASAWVSREQMSHIHDLLPVSGADAAVVVLAQVLFVPTAAAWALAWLAGPGFSVGVDALHAPGTAPVAPIPAIPLLGAVPQTAPGDHVALVLVGVGVCLGVWVAVRHRALRLVDQALAGLVAAGVVAAVSALALWLSMLSLGTERLAVLGPRVGWATAMIVLEVVVTSQVVAAAAHPSTVALVRRGVRAVLVPRIEPVDVSDQGVPGGRTGFGDEGAIGHEDGPVGGWSHHGETRAPHVPRTPHPPHTPAEPRMSTASRTFAGREAATVRRARRGDDTRTSRIDVSEVSEVSAGSDWRDPSGDPNADDAQTGATTVRTPPGATATTKEQP